VNESAVLAMGALAEGCEEGLIQRNYLPNFVVHLITAFLPCDKPLVRSITCWTLSRYSRWICYQVNPETQQPAMLAPLLDGLLKCMLDNSKKVRSRREGTSM